MADRAVRARVRRAAVGAAVGVASCCAVVAAPALAGSTTQVGNESLTVSGSLASILVGARGTSLKFHVDYESLTPGQRIGGSNKQIQLQLPEGSSFNGQNLPQCPYSKIGSVPIKQIPSICGSSTIIGSGSFTGDARPLMPNPVPGTITLYNVKGQHNDVLFYAHTKFEDFAYLFLYTNTDFDNDGDHDPVLQADFSPPKNGSSSLFNLKTIDLTFKATSSAHPLLINPPNCGKHGWTMGLAISTYGGPPPIEATHNVTCKPKPLVKKHKSKKNKKK